MLRALNGVIVRCILSASKRSEALGGARELSRSADVNQHMQQQNQIAQQADILVGQIDARQ